MPTTDPLRKTIDFCRGTPPPAVDGSVGGTIYYRVEFDAWYKTDDLFATSQWIAPYGELSHDLNYLVTFACEGQGTICIASPPLETPQVISAGDMLPAGDLIVRSEWLADNRRLVFEARRKRVAYEDPVNWLLVLDASTGEITTIDDSYIGSWDVSRAHDCIAYTACNGNGSGFHVARLGLHGVEEEWAAPQLIDSTRIEWPGCLDPVAWSSGGEQIAFNATSNSRVWDIVTGEQRAFRSSKSEGWANTSSQILDWSPNDTYVFIVSDKLWLLEVSSGRLTGGRSDPHALRWHYWWLPDSKRMVVPSWDESVVITPSTGAGWRFEYSGSGKTQYVDDLFW